MAPPARSPRSASATFRYGLAIGSVALAAAITTGPGGERLFPEPPERFVHGVTFLYAAAILSAWLGGRGPGALAALLAALVVDIFITPPLYSITLDWDFLLRILVFTLSALLVGWLSVRRHRTEEALRLSRDQLEQRVAERTADLTRSNEQLHAEIAARARAEETLREQAALLDLTHDTVFVRDEGDVITYWNRGAEELYGWSRAEAIGTIAHARMQTVFPVPFDDLMTEVHRTGRWEGELVHTRRDGSTVVVASRWALRPAGPGRPAVILETNNDITERKRAEDGLDRARAELAHITRVTTLGELAASIAHEINQPLAAIVADANACLHWLDADPVPVGQVREALSAIVSDGDRAAEVLTRIRTLLARSPVARQPCRLADVVSDVLPLVSPQMSRHGVTLQASVDPGAPAVLGDRIQLQQVVLNLLVNALEAMREVPAERRRLVVCAGRRTMDDRLWAAVTVQDGGVGVDSAETARLFEPFFTTKPGGLGMGLSISRSIVDSHGGRLWATVNPDHGVTMHVALPAIP
ncbi:MAG TPA: ATP-binding protein [Methylomirabilota bacterium]|nr:ATP-binding protein [Methylomirabilota bacterium]